MLRPWRDELSCTSAVPPRHLQPFQIPLGGITRADPLWEARGAPNPAVYKCFLPWGVWDHPLLTPLWEVRGVPGHIIYE